VNPNHWTAQNQNTKTGNKIGKQETEIGKQETEICKQETKISKDRFEIPPSVRLFAKTKYQMIDPKYIRRCACSQKQNTKWSIRNISVGAPVRKNEIPNDRSEISPSVRLFAKMKYQMIDPKYEKWKPN
jgi:hypothetical protein